jgi:hypothetical protein
MSDTPGCPTGHSRGPNRDEMDDRAQIAQVRSMSADGRAWRGTGGMRGPGAQGGPGASSGPGVQSGAGIQSGPGPGGRGRPEGWTGAAGRQGQTGAVCWKCQTLAGSGRQTGQTDGTGRVGHAEWECALGVARWVAHAEREGASACVAQIRAKTATRRYVGKPTNLGWIRLGPLNYCNGVSPSETPGQWRGLALITMSNQMHTESNIFKFVMT